MNTDTVKLIRTKIQIFKEDSLLHNKGKGPSEGVFFVNNKSKFGIGKQLSKSPNFNSKRARTEKKSHRTRKSKSGFIK